MPPPALPSSPSTSARLAGGSGRRSGGTIKEEEEPESPTSPTGRIAKRNARALNGSSNNKLMMKSRGERKKVQEDKPRKGEFIVVDLKTGKRRASYADGNLVGLLPELKTSDLNERCPAVKAVLDAAGMDDWEGGFVTG